MQRPRTQRWRFEQKSVRWRRQQSSPLPNPSPKLRQMARPSRWAASNRDAARRANVRTQPARKFSRKAAIPPPATPPSRPIHRGAVLRHISWCKKRAHPPVSPHRAPEQFPDAQSAPTRAPRAATAPPARPNDPANPEPSWPRAAQAANLPQGKPRPCLRVPARRQSDTACPINPARSPHRAAAQPHHRKANSCGINPKNRAGLAAKFFFGRAHLAQFLERDSPELAPRKRKIIGNVGHCDPKIARQIVIARAPTAAILQVVDLKKPEVNLLSAPLTFPAQSLHGQRKQTAHPFLLEKF